MKKLLTFAGISALALITAAPDAFGAAGSYNPSCNANEVTIKFYGMAKPSNSTTPTISPLGTALYKSGKWYKKDGTVATKFGDLGVTIPTIDGSIALNNITATNGAIAYRADFHGDVVSTPSANQLTGTSVCASAAPDQSMGVLSTSTLPTISPTNIQNRTELSYIVMYAAKCVAGTNATCDLSIKDKQAQYKNTCTSGYGANDNNSFSNQVCFSGAIPIVLPENPETPSINY